MVAAVAGADDYRTGQIIVSVIRSPPRGLGSVLIRCPLTAVRKINAAGEGNLRERCSAAKVHPPPMCRHH
jgi:hypothetical protein